METTGVMAPDVPTSEQVKEFLRERLLAAVDEGCEQGDAPPAAQAWLDDLLSAPDSYRDGALILVAYEVLAGGGLDVRERPPGARGVAGFLGETLLPSLKIPCRKSAFQNIAKNTKSLIRGNRQSWDALVAWLSDEASVAELDQSFGYLLAGIATTARPVPDMPELDVGRLTFARVTALIEALFSVPSGGAYQQFMFAALLDACAGETGNPRERVETKGINVSDLSGGAGDIEHWVGGVVQEAYEVSANDWAGKVDQALESIRRRDLRRSHIIARAERATAQDFAALLPPDMDVSVLDLHHEARSLVARLQRPGRQEALRRMYRLLLEKQSDPSFVTQYVAMLSDQGLVLRGEGSEEAQP